MLLLLEVFVVVIKLLGKYILTIHNTGVSKLYYM